MRKHEKNARERVKTASVRGENPSHKDLNRLNKPVTKYDFEEAVVSLSLDNVVDYLTFDKSSSKGWKDLAGTVFHQTRAVAEAPLKLKKGLSGSGGFSFWARADSKDCVDSKNPNGWNLEQPLVFKLPNPLIKDDQYHFQMFKGLKNVILYWKDADFMINHPVAKKFHKWQRNQN